MRKEKKWNFDSVNSYLLWLMLDVESGPSTTVIRFLMKNCSDFLFFFLSLVEVSNFRFSCS